MDHIESRGWEPAVNRTPCLLPLEFLDRWASVHIWKDESLGGVPEGAIVSAHGLCDDLPQLGGHTRGCQEAEPFEYVTSWDAAVVKPGNW